MNEAVDITASAAKRVASIAARQGRPAILRLAVDGGGCAGFQYKFGLADAVEQDDAVAERDGVRLVVDAISCAGARSITSNRSAARRSA